MKTKSKVLRLAACIVLCELAGLIGAVFTTPAIPTWYASLAKPAFSPPNWLFAPVWTALFALMGVSLYLAWSKGLTKSRMAAAAFAIQFALNIGWSFLFFGLKSPLYAFAEIVMLWVSIAATIALFWKLDRRAALMLVPYICWVSFASLLNYAVWTLN